MLLASNTSQMVLKRSVSWAIREAFFALLAILLFVFIIGCVEHADIWLSVTDRSLKIYAIQTYSPSTRSEITYLSIICKTQTMNRGLRERFCLQNSQSIRKRHTSLIRREMQGLRGNGFFTIQHQAKST